ncbi:MAG: hypothetical protein U1F24_00645 [Alphaproteobacteria bacterium]
MIAAITGLAQSSRRGGGGRRSSLARGEARDARLLRALVVIAFTSSPEQKADRRCDDRDADLRVGVDVAEGAFQLVIGAPVEGVAHLRPVDGHGGDVTLERVAQLGEGFGRDRHAHGNKTSRFQPLQRRAHSAQPSMDLS